MRKILDTILTILLYSLLFLGMIIVIIVVLKLFSK